MYSRLSFLLALLALLSAGATKAAEKGGGRSCRIVFLKAPADAPKRLHLFDGTTSQEVELPRFNLSRPYEISAAASSIAMTTKAVVSAEDVPAGAPRVAIPESVADCYLLVVSDPGNQVAPVEIRLLDAGRSAFRKGQMMWYNLSDKAVGGRVGSEELAMMPGSRKILDAPARRAGEYEVVLNYRRKEDERLHPLCETKWRHDPETRTLLFIVGENGTRTPRIMGFPDDRIETEEEEEGK